MNALDVVCHMSSWGAAVFLLLASLLGDDERRNDT
jgi:hypothetical protein